MLRLSTKIRYGLRFMIALAEQQSDKPISLGEISARENISEKYLWQVVKPLRDAGLIASVAGAHGGYRLLRDQAQITLGDILEILDGPLIPSDANFQQEQVKHSTDRVVTEVWTSLGEVLTNELQQPTLAQLARKSRELNSETPPDYII